MDIWSLGVIVLEWMYGIPQPPKLPRGRAPNHIQPDSWGSWVDTWSGHLQERLYDQEDCVLLKMLSKMLQLEDRRRWEAERLLR